MADDKAEKTGAERPTSATGLGRLVMNEVPASATVEASEVPRRVGLTWLLLVVILIVVGILGYGAKTVLNMRPGQDAEEQLRTRMESLPAWGQGLVLGARYTAGDRLRLEVSPGFRADTAGLRQTVIEVMKVFMELRPNRDLYIDAFAQESQVAWGEYHAKEKIKVAGGRLEPDIRVRAVGEEGGIGQLVKPSAPRE